jgi:hypothetical protein
MDNKLPYYATMKVRMKSDPPCPQSQTVKGGEWDNVNATATTTLSTISTCHGGQLQQRNDLMTRLMAHLSVTLTLLS